MARGAEGDAVTKLELAFERLCSVWNLSAAEERRLLDAIRRLARSRRARLAKKAGR